MKDQINAAIYKLVVLIVQIILFVLKCAGVLNWPWIWVFAPTWIWLLFVFIVTIIVLRLISK